MARNSTDSSQKGTQEIPHTPGPWALGFANKAKAFVNAGPHCICKCDTSDGSIDPLPNARLIAAAPDHALLLRCICRGLARWEQWEDGQRGEICCGGMRYATHLDDFGCPVVSEHVRGVLTKAEGK